MHKKTADYYQSLTTPCQLSLVFNMIEALFTGKTVLDVGCATGDYLSRFSSASIGIDYSESNLKVCKTKRLNAIKADLNEGLPVDDESFDVVFCTHVIEHVDSPLFLLREMHRVVRKDGIIILSHPIENSLTRIILCDGYFKGHPSHLYSFTLAGIKRLFDIAGLEIVTVYLDYPILRRFNLMWALKALQYLPLRLGLLFAGNVWLLAYRKGLAVSQAAS